MIIKKSKKDRNVSLSTIFFTVVLIFFSLLLFHDSIINLNVFKRFELMYLDKLFLSRDIQPNLKDSLDVILVLIKDETSQTLPDKFPFPRRYYAKAIENLNKAGAKIIGVDLIFDQESNKFDDSVLFSTISKYKNVVVGGKTDLASGDYSIKRNEENFNSIFFLADSSIGIVYIPSDEDGVYRRYYPFAKMPYQEVYAPSFAISMFNKAINGKGNSTPNLKENYFEINNQNYSLFDETTFLINYYGLAGNTFREIDISNILDDSTFKTREEIELGIDINLFDDPIAGLITENIFKDKYVIIGPGFTESKDMFPVSVAPKEMPDKNLMYGAEIHAHALQSLIDNNFINRIPKLIEAFIIALGSILTFAFSIFTKKINFRYNFINELIIFLFVGVLILLTHYASIYFFNKYNLLLPTISLITTYSFTYIGNTVYNYIQERKQKKFLSNMFSSMVSPEVLIFMQADPERLQLKGERKDATMFFSDLRGFTTISESVSPEELSKILNDYLTPMSNIILDYGGYIDKYEGDAIMADFGVPVWNDPDPNSHAWKCCWAALDQQKELLKVSKYFLTNYNVEIDARMGINTGIVAAGNMGSEKKFQYTVMGDAVNQAARFEPANKIFETHIMIGEPTYELAKDKIEARLIALLIVKGKTEPVKAYELLAKKGELSAEKEKLIKIFNEGWQLHAEQKFIDAIEKFNQCLIIDPSDGPSKTYKKLCEELIINPPAKNWCGQWIQISK